MNLFNLPILFEATRYRFTFQLHDALNLPEYAGSTLRGVFGQALKKTACIQMKVNRQLLFNELDCKTCTFNQECSYPQIFESNPIYFQEKKSNLLYYSQKIDTISNPYIIDPLSFDQNIEKQKRRYQSGDLFSFEMVLIGTAQESLAFIIFAWQKALLEQGLTKAKVKASLLYVEKIDPFDNINSQIIYNLTDEENQNPQILDHQPTQIDVSTPHEMNQITFELKTPLRIMSQRDVLKPDQITPILLITNMIRRVLLISQYYWLNPQTTLENFDSKQYFLNLKEKMEHLESVEQNLEFYTWQRYSSRQKQSMNLWGILGTWTISGDFSELYPFIKIIEQIHLGKNTSFGLGKIALIKS